MVKKYEYLDEVQKELNRRQHMLHQATMDLERLEHELQTIEATAAVFRGTTAAIVQSEAYRNVLRQKIVAQRAKRAGIIEEVQRAQERKKSVEEELEGESGE